MAHPNQEPIQRGYEAFGRGDMQAVLAEIADDLKWHVSGRSPVAGDYEGHQGLVNFVTQLMERSGGTFRVEVHDFTASDDHVVALLRETATRGTKSLDTNQIHIWHVKDGKGSECWSSSADQYVWDEFWE